MKCYKKQVNFEILTPRSQKVNLRDIQISPQSDGNVNTPGEMLSGFSSGAIF